VAKVCEYGSRIAGGRDRPARASVVAAQTDLDAFMQQVLARRDDNWKKLQQYVLDEREVIALKRSGALGDLE